MGRMVLHRELGGVDPFTLLSLYYTCTFFLLLLSALVFFLFSVEHIEGITGFLVTGDTVRLSISHGFVTY